jgi:predicted PurR-regulated permease PerM
VEFLRAQREKRLAFVIRDPDPVKDVGDVWSSLSQIATVGIFLLLFGVLLFFSRALLLPIFAAAVISTTLSPVMKAASRRGVPRGITALLIVGTVVATAVVGITLLAGPVSEWIGRAPDIGNEIKSKLYFLNAPLAALHELTASVSSSNASIVKMDTPLSDLLAPAVGYLTPAAGQTVLFVITLIFLLIGHVQLRNFVVSMMASREAKLRCLRIANDIEQNLARYLTTVTLINATLGAIVMVVAWAVGLPHPFVFGLLAAILNYVPYLGPATMVFILFGVGLVVFPALSQVLVAPAIFIGLTTVEGQFIMPMIVGRRLTLNPLAIFLMIAFWAWLWGPIGAFLAIPLSIVGLVISNHLFPAEEGLQLPE